jgi:hypothetical protein
MSNRGFFQSIIDAIFGTTPPPAKASEVKSASQPVATASVVAV